MFSMKDPNDIERVCRNKKSVIRFETDRTQETGGGPHSGKKYDKREN